MSDSPKPTETELRILRALWELGPATVRQVHQHLDPTHESAYTGTLRMMQVMHQKGLLEREDQDRAHTYRPVDSRERTQQGMVAHLLDRAFAGSARDLVQAALRSGTVSAEERRAIRELLDQEEGR